MKTGKKKEKKNEKKQNDNMGERAAEPEGEYVEIRGGEEGEGDETEAEEKGG